MSTNHLIDRPLTLNECHDIGVEMFLGGTIVKFELFDGKKRIVSINSLITLLKGDSRVKGLDLHPKSKGSKVCRKRKRG